MVLFATVSWSLTYGEQKEKLTKTVGQTSIPKECLSLLVRRGELIDAIHE